MSLEARHGRNRWLLAGEVVLVAALIEFYIWWLQTFVAITVATGFEEAGNYIWWGLIQQYVLNAFFVNRLIGILGERRTHAACVLAAVLFTINPGQYTHFGFFRRAEIGNEYTVPGFTG